MLAPSRRREVRPDGSTVVAVVRPEDDRIDELTGVVFYVLDAACVGSAVVLLLVAGLRDWLSMPLAIGAAALVAGSGVLGTVVYYLSKRPYRVIVAVDGRLSYQAVVIGRRAAHVLRSEQLELLDRADERNGQALGMRGQADRQSLTSFLRVLRNRLEADLASHRPPPTSSYGSERHGLHGPERAQAELYRLASMVAGGETLVERDLAALRSLRSDVLGSLHLAPTEVQPNWCALAETATQAQVIEWMRRVGERFGRLEGSSVTGWSGVAMALREKRIDNRPQFKDPAVPFTQYLFLDLDTDSGRHRVRCYQSDSLFGLNVDAAEKDDVTFGGIYRSVTDHEAPVGVVEQVDVMVEEGVIAEVELRIAGRRVLLVAGEVDEGPGSALIMRRFDESVLLFHDADHVEDLIWLPPRHSNPE